MEFFFDNQHENSKSNGILIYLFYLLLSFFFFFRLSNGYTIKIGRGLHYFLPAEKFCLGQSNYDFRKCKETNVDIYRFPLV